MSALFIFSAILTLIGTAVVVSQRNAIYALLGLLVAFFGTSGVFLSLDAAFLAVSQILIYAGALAVLFLFVLMFTDTRTRDETELPRAVGARAVFDPAEATEAKVEKGPRISGWGMPRPLAAVVALSFFVCVAYSVNQLPEDYDKFGELEAAEGQAPLFGGVNEIAQVTFKKFPLAFEVVSLVILAAVLGAVLLARRHLDTQVSSEKGEG